VALQQFPNSDQEAVLTPLSIYTKNVMTCNRDSSHQSVGHTSEPDPFITVEIPTDNTSIHHVIEQEFHEGTVIEDWRCSQCHNVGGTKRKFIQDGLMPEFLLVKLKRYGVLGGRGYKIQTPVNAPLGFALEGHDSFINPYSLCGVLTHIGSQIKFGHYITEIRKGDNWFKCNDNKVSPTTFDQLSNQAYGFLFQKM
jgi:ubiquitin C-terminal hydrolase